LCAIILYKTPYGYHLRAVGRDEKAAQNAGISVYWHRLYALALSGLFAGLGGCALALPLQTFVGGMTNGRGWIALVAVILGGGKPSGVFIASLIFGAASALSNWLQASAPMSPKLMMTLPFLITLLFMIVKKNNTEEGV
ncbi:MAG TPA: ABC transporter permease, partial [Thermotogota bacterium]|nr:ABC transporter permease [Thermotogota bacterium]